MSTYFSGAEAKKKEKSYNPLASGIITLIYREFCTDVSSNPTRPFGKAHETSRNFIKH